MEDAKYRQTKAPIRSTLTTVQDNDYRWGVIDSEGNVVVPFGKYAWIDGFQNGLAKVIGHDDTMSKLLLYKVNLETGEIDYSRVAHQGIINEEGEEVLPPDYEVWKFYGKDFPTIRYFKGQEAYSVSFGALNPSLVDDDKDVFSDRFDDDYIDYRRESWDAMTDGQYGDMPDGFDGDYDFLGC